jgi:hypothetical protein
MIHGDNTATAGQTRTLTRAKKIPFMEDAQVHELPQQKVNRAQRVAPLERLGKTKELHRERRSRENNGQDTGYRVMVARRTLGGCM